MWTPAEKLAELERESTPHLDGCHLTATPADISPSDVQTFAKEFFARMYIETLVHGNMDVKVCNGESLERWNTDSRRLPSICNRWSSACSVLSP